MKILVSGDFCPVKQVENFILNNTTDHSSDIFFKDIKKYINESDLFITNLEAPLTNSSQPILKSGPAIKGNPIAAEILAKSGVNLVTLANNHIYDYGEKGLNDTMENCHKYELSCVGAGKCIDTARNIFYKNIDNKRLAVINFAENEFGNANCSHGGANPFDYMENTKSILEAKKKSDFILIIFHGGSELYRYPTPNMVKTCRFFVEMGASAVICHHSHVPSGHEVYKNSPIFYGIGNFIFPPTESSPEEWSYGYMVLLENDGTKFNFRIIPYEQDYSDNNITLRLITTEKKWYQNLTKISEVIQSDIELKNKWQNYSGQKEFNCMKTLYFMTQKHLFKILYHFIPEKILFPRKGLLSLYNLLKCESHREITLNLLEKKLGLNEENGRRDN